jgi:hypothetical protein
MHYVEIVTAILTIVGIGLSLLGRQLSTETGAAPVKPGAPYLAVFAAAVVVFGGFNLFFYRGEHGEDRTLTGASTVAKRGGAKQSFMCERNDPLSKPRR